MTIDDNEQAVNIMRKFIGSFENRARALYNYGYKDGFEAGVEATTREIAKIIIERSEETEGE